MSSSDILVYVLVAAHVAKPLAKCLSTLIECYRQILEIRVLRDQLKSKGVPPEKLADIGTHASEQMEKVIATETAALLENSPADAPRKNELKKLVSDALWHFAERLDQGYNFDVRASEAAESSEDEEQRTDAEAIRNIRKSLEFMNVTGDRILKLSPGEDGGAEEPAPKAKPAKPEPKKDQR